MLYISIEENDLGSCWQRREVLWCKRMISFPFFFFLVYMNTGEVPFPQKKKKTLSRSLIQVHFFLYYNMTIKPTQNVHFAKVNFIYLCRYHNLIRIYKRKIH